MQLGTRSFVWAIAVLLVANAAQAATWYVAPTASGLANGSSPANAFGNLNTAFQAATQGDIIEMAGGTYSVPGTGTLSINDKAATSSWLDNVIFRPAAGQTATIASRLNVNANRVTLDGITATAPIFLQQGTIGYNTVQNSTLSSTLFVRKHNSQVLNNDFVNGVNADAIQIGGRTGDQSFAQRSNNILIEGNYIRDYRNDPPNDPTDVHEDGIQLFDTQNVTIRNNVISNVSNATIIMSAGSNRGIQNVLIENNFLRTTDNPGSYPLDGFGVVDLLQAANTYQNIQFINNTIMSDIHIGNTNQILLRNNIISRIHAMGFLVQHDHNLIGSIRSGQGITADVTDRVGTLPSIVSYATGDLHIAPNNLVDLAFGTNVGAPQYDIDGELRNFPIWVGADQVGTVVPEPTVWLLTLSGLVGAVPYRRRAG